MTTLYILLGLVLLVASPFIAKFAFRIAGGWVDTWKEAIDIIRK